MHGCYDELLAKQGCGGRRFPLLSWRKTQSLQVLYAHLVLQHKGSAGIGLHMDVTEKLAATQADREHYITYDIHAAGLL